MKKLPLTLLVLGALSLTSCQSCTLKSKSQEVTPGQPHQQHHQQHHQPVAELLPPEHETTNCTLN